MAIDLSCPYHRVAYEALRLTEAGREDDGFRMILQGIDLWWSRERLWIVCRNGRESVSDQGRFTFLDRFFKLTGPRF